MKALITSLLLLVPAFTTAQQPHVAALKPVHVAIVTNGDEGPTSEFKRLFQDALKKRRNVIISPRRGGMVIYLAAREVTANGKFIGYTAVALAVSESKPQDNYWLSLKTAPTLEGAAREAAEDLNSEVFSKLKE